MEQAISADLANLQKLVEYRRPREHVFPSDSALNWFVRLHRAELIAEGALVMLVGQWHAVPSKFDAFILAVGQRKAQQRAKAA